MKLTTIFITAIILSLSFNYINGAPQFSESKVHSSNSYLIQANSHIDIQENIQGKTTANSKIRGTPTPASCSFLIILGFTVMIYAVYLMRQFKHFSQEEMSTEKWSDRLITHILASKPSDMIVFIPVICLTIFFIVFRANTQNILEDDSDYIVFQNGVILLTIGIFLRILDVLSFSLHSNAFGNLSQTLGNFFIITSFGIILWALFSLRSSFQSVTIEVKSFISLSVLVIIVEIVLKFVEYWKRYNSEWKKKDDNETTEKTETEILNKLLDDQQKEEIGDATSFASLLMICLFFLIFQHYKSAPISETQRISIIFCTSGIFVLVGLSVLKLFESKIIHSISYVVKTITLITIYGAFFVLIYCTTNSGMQFHALMFVYVLLFVIGSLMLVVTFGQEASSFLLNQEKQEEEINEKREESTLEKFKNISKVLKDMTTTIEFAKVICIACLYIHFRAEIFLKRNSNDFVNDFSYLRILMELSTAAILLQMLGQVGEFFVGFNPFLSLVIGFCFFLSAVGLFGFVVAATTYS